jgi:PleD family two-component response regulator
MLPRKIEEVRESPRNPGRAYQKFISASVGVTPYSNRIPFDAAIEMADKMMYERKKARKETREEAVERPRLRETSVRELDKPN